MYSPSQHKSVANNLLYIFFTDLPQVPINEEQPTDAVPQGYIRRNSITLKYDIWNTSRRQLARWPTIR